MAHPNPPTPRSAAPAATAALLVGAGAGAASGIVWLAVYGWHTPVAHLASIALLGHLLAGSLLGLAIWSLGCLVGRALPTARTTGSGPVFLAVLLALVVAPAVLGPFYRAALLWGVRGALVDVAAVGISLLLGFALGLAWRRGGLRRVLVAAALAICLAVPVLVTLHLAPNRQPALLARPVTADFPHAPVLVFGIDGGDWRVAGPLLAAGRLPNLATIVAEGRHGVLRSIVPTKSPVVWSSLFSGQPPAVHGIDDWYDADSRNLQAAALWDIVVAHGGSALAVNVPGTWPPQRREPVAVVAGMPTPGFDTRGLDMPLGSVVSGEPERGDVPTLLAGRDGDGGWRFTLPLGHPFRPAPRLDLANVFLEKIGRRLPIRGGLTVDLTARREGGAVVLEGPLLAATARLPVDGRPRWVRIESGDTEAVLLASVLEATPERLRLYLSQAITAPWRPAPPFAANLPGGLLSDRARPYVVEGPGWTAGRDPRLRRAVADMILEVEERRAELLVAAVRRLRPQATSVVMTATDRLQHAFLSLRPESGGTAPPTDLAGRDPVSEAYELADRTLGRLRALLPPDTLVLVVSDHGSEVAEDGGPSGHRLAGMWAAAGPGVAHSAAPLELGILDVLPTLLHCLGAPPAGDLPQPAVRSLCPEVAPRPAVPSYGGAAGGDGRDRRIDPTREEQLRSLGYL